MNDVRKDMSLINETRRNRVTGNEARNNRTANERSLRNVAIDTDSLRLKLQTVLKQSQLLLNELDALETGTKQSVQSDDVTTTTDAGADLPTRVEVSE